MLKNILTRNFCTNFKNLREKSNLNINSTLFFKSKNSLNSNYVNFYRNNNLIRKFCTKNNRNTKNQPNQKKLSKWKSLKQKIKTYGLFGLYFYIFSYIATFGFFYVLTKLKIINSDKFFTKAEEWGLEKYIDINGIRE
jgi:hypothetical protein